jgi:hypothetical protein
MNAASGACYVGFSLLFALSVPAFSAVARAASTGPQPAALSWTRGRGAESCPDASDVERGVELRLGRAALVPKERAELVVEAVAERTQSGGFRVQIALLRADEVIGRRVLEGTEPECLTIADKAVLAIALMIDPDAALAPPLETAPPPGPPEREPQASTKSNAIVDRPPPPTAQPLPSRTPWQGDVELAAGVASGLVPGLAPAVFLRGRLFPPAFPLGVEIEGALFPEQTQYETPARGAHFSLIYGGLSLCSRPPRALRLTASFCGGADMGSVLGEGFGFDEDQDFQESFLALGVRGRLWVRPVSGVAIVMGPDLTIPLKRDYFVTGRSSGSVELFRMSRTAFGFELGAVWEL